ncbi:MAG: terminase [Actinomycetota bacterium]
MAVHGAAVDAPVEDEFHDVIAWYQDKLAEPAVFPWSGTEWEPIRIGPTWQTTPDGHWLLPEATIGWQQLGWAGTMLQLRRGEPWRFTLEQARWLLWWGAVDETGQFLNVDGVLQRLKGWGKDPKLAVLSLIEAFGPARFLEWDGDEPVACDVPEAWIQLAAVSLEQTKNTTRLFPGLLTERAKDEYGIRVGKELIYGLGDERLIQAVTSSPATLEGARATFVGKNETQHWLASNDGHEMADVIERNSTKSPGGTARTLSITNAPEPSQDSVAMRDREAYELAQAGESLTTGLMYDSLEAPPEAPLTAEAAPEVLRGVRGDSSWLDVGRIVQSILDTRNPPSRSRRFWYNQVVAAEDAWVDPQRFDSLARPDIVVDREDELVAFFDGSKSQDTTGLVGVRMSDGHGVTIGMWQRPPGERGVGWTAPRVAIDEAVDAMFDRYNVIGFWADPSHAEDDETGERYWDDIIDGWHHRYSDRLRVWAQKGKHSVMWDMTSPTRAAEFTAAAERTVADVDRAADEVKAELAPSVTWDGDHRLKRHVHNAREYDTRWGTSLGKANRSSKQKVDLAVCWVGARMLRRVVQLTPEPKRKKQPGRGRGWR